MDKITQALEWAEKRMEGWEPFTKNQMEMLHFAFHELKQLPVAVVMQAEGSDVCKHENAVIRDGDFGYCMECKHESYFETKTGYHCNNCHLEWERA